MSYVWLIILWSVGLFIVWKLGKNNGANDEKLSKSNESEKNLAKAVDLRNNVDRDIDGVRNKWKRSKQ